MLSVASFPGPQSPWRPTGRVELCVYSPRQLTCLIVHVQRHAELACQFGAFGLHALRRPDPATRQPQGRRRNDTPKVDWNVEAFRIAVHHQVLVLHVLPGVEAVVIFLVESSVPVCLPITRGWSWPAKRKMCRNAPEIVDTAGAQHVAEENIIHVVWLHVLLQTCRAKNNPQFLECIDVGRITFFVSVPSGQPESQLLAPVPCHRAPTSGFCTYCRIVLPMIGCPLLL